MINFFANKLQTTITIIQTTASLSKKNICCLLKITSKHTKLLMYTFSYALISLFFGGSSNRQISNEPILLNDEWELLTICGASLNSSNSSKSADIGAFNKIYCSDLVGHNKCAITQYAKQSAEYVMPDKKFLN